ncbi:Aldo/keto reductase [Wallemia mellicola]|uniref:Aldo/keto reductase n=1 Tax=Wallemia mellicola TaxID=1708541 RepID=A0A4T0PCZ1_9BASI|nr:hypothetical protein E3Q24_01105 [Wallemia mellicola]TIB75633.1 Aldo/keto reductase [Wallemia mellicola]TIB88069.1 Aldo/keto reductase [Wallemia mellicola]TIB90757.1 Aldo/keto reductase [Wallemia mellicola]TIB96339.1 Aldo/keto reductase [Wallemia mellicola]
MSSYGPKRDVNASGWEESEFPILCDDCLGPNPMQKRAFGKECKICMRPFTLFSWCPGAGTRYKKTEIYLTYKIPVHLRDAALGMQSKAPTENLNRQYFAQNNEEQLKGNSTMVDGGLGRAENAGKQILRDLAKKEPYYKPTKEQKSSNKPKEIKSMPLTSTQSVAAAPKMIKLDLKPPLDTEVLPDDTTEDELKSAFGDASPSIQSATIVPTSKVSFVNFASRQAAEIAALVISKKGLIVRNEAVSVKWGRRAMTFGAKGKEQARVHDYETVQEIIDIFGEHGHKEIDTARMYGGGTSEEYLGHLQIHRKYDLSSKIFPFDQSSNALSGGKNSVKHTAKDIEEEIDTSLKNLGVKKLKIWYLHAPDRSTDYLETLRALDVQYKQGKFELLGLSNYASWEVAEIATLARVHDLVKPSIYQGVYSAIHRAVEPELFPALRKFGIGFYAYNPLAGGLLTGAVKLGGSVEEGSRFDENRHQGKLYRARYFNEGYSNALNEFIKLATKYSLSPAEVALRWLTHHSFLKKESGDAIIIGASSIKHIKSNLDDLDKGLLPEELAEEVAGLWTTLKPYANSYFR